MTQNSEEFYDKPIIRKLYDNWLFVSVVNIVWIIWLIVIWVWDIPNELPSLLMLLYVIFLFGFIANLTFGVALILRKFEFHKKQKLEGKNDSKS